MFKVVLEKAEEPEEPEIQLAISAGSLEKQKSSRKTSISVYWLRQSLQLCVTINCGKFWKDGNTRPPDLPSCMQVRKKQLEVDMEKQTGSK